MKPITGTQYKTQGTIAGESIEFGFDSNSLAHLQSILSDLYSKPHTAVLRELSANALDAQIDAGYEGPIEVTTPNALNPTLTVTDHGIGMSIDDLYNIYTKYGASTKRESNAVVGMLGIGSKSPLAIASQFSITTVRDGVKIVAMVKKNEQGVGELTIIDTIATDEPSGTTIKVPSDTDASWFDIAQDLFRFWEPNTVIVDGREPKTIQGDRVDDDILIVTDQSLTHDMLIMGNIAYPITHENSFFIRNSYYHTERIIVRVPVGSVQFAPSREELNYSEVTKAYLNDLAADVSLRIHKYLETHIDTIDEPAEAFAFYRKWNSGRFSGIVPSVWRGNDIPDRLTVNGYQWNKKYNYRARTYYTNYIYVANLIQNNRYFFITGYTEDKAPSQTLKARLFHYLEQNGKSTDRDFVFLETLDTEVGWYDSLESVSVAELKAIKMPRKASRSTTPGVKREKDWEVYQSGVFSEVDSQDISGTYYYTNRADYTPNMLEKLSKLTDATIVVANQNRWSRLLRELPAGQYVTELIQSSFDSITLTDDEAYSLDAHIPSELEFLHRDHSDKLERLEDKQLLADIKKFHDTRNLKTPNLQLLGLLANFGKHRQGQRINIGKDYPLLDALYPWRLSDTSAEHVVIYMNAVYAQKDLSQDDN